MKLVLGVLLICIGFSSSAAICPVESEVTGEKGIFMDVENKICFVDLLAFNETIISISLQDENGMELENVNCLDLDVREIVEFDLESYRIEKFILSFDSVGKKIESTISL